MPAAAVVGRQPHVDAQPLKIFDAGEIIGRASAVAERDAPASARSRGGSPYFFAQAPPGQREKRRLADAAGDHDEVLPPLAPGS